MNNLICPISKDKVNKSVVRTTGFLVATTVAFYAMSGNVLFMLVLFIDFIIRGFTTLQISPYAFVSKKIVKALKFKPTFIDKAPKLFAARVGFVFSITSIFLYYISPTSSLIVAFILMFFALLEAVFDFCVGCIVYTYIVLPLNKTPIS